ncbi:MAG TPA: hypothetical protein DF409_14985 [Bacteroidales bacterium]|jgi:hypothetical protein|nr:hypothetical protein [Bacteroidales bacterium]
MNKLIVMCLLLPAIYASGQKKPFYQMKNEIIEKAIAELDSVSSVPGSAFLKEINESKLSGTYVFDITLREKGEVATVFVVNDGESPIAMQNRLKDIVKRYRFGFRVPKGKSYKFQYTFKF